MNREFLRCPVCRAALDYGSNRRSLLCPAGHCFDISASGYVNLTRGSSAPTSGDSPDMIRARRDFLAAGYYAPISDALNSYVSNIPHSAIIDAGCGEGYYTSRLAAFLPESRVTGFDLSKSGIELSAKAAKRDGLSERLSFCVGGIFDLPVRDGCADVVINLFAPCCGEEFGRILRPGGRLILGVAGVRHLFGLKNVIYDTPYENELRRDVIDGFTLTEVRNINYETVIPGEHILPLFSMTPYYFRTSPADKNKLWGIESLRTEVSVDLLIYERR